MHLAPRIEGELSVRSSIGDFLLAFRRRVDSGLVAARPQRRSKYLITEEAPEFVRVRAANFATAIAVGLNDVELRFQRPHTLRYEVRYWRWAAYAVGVGAATGLVGLMALMIFDVRAYIETQPSSRVPGLSIDQNMLIVWALVFFFGFVFPWVLIAIHKRPLRRLLAQVIEEVDQSAVLNS